MYNMTPEHLAAVTLQAKRETELHTRNVGIYGSSVGDTTEERLIVRDCLLNIVIKRWVYDGIKPSQYRKTMAKAERCVEVYIERIVAQRVLDILAGHNFKRQNRDR